MNVFIVSYRELWRYNK